MQRIGTLAALLLLTANTGIAGLLLPAGFTETTVAIGLTEATAMALAPDGRVFICEQAGTLRVSKNGALLPTPFVSLTVDSSGERGLIGVTLDPNFPTNQYVYVYYTVPSPAHNRLSRFTANGDVAVPGSETILFELDNLSAATNHNGGALHFGLDGKLYIGVGDNATGSNSQSLTSLFGKMLRLNSDGSIPTDNPFYNQTTGKYRAIWAMGLRNPFTFAVDPASGTIFINDVGQSNYEEIDVGTPGANYGWPSCEGPCGNPNYVDPWYSYSHASGGCAIAGGDFYSPLVPQFPSDYIGDYFFADYCGDWIKRIDTGSQAVTTFIPNGTIQAPVDLRVGYDGALYYLARNAGKVSKVTYTGSNAPAITEDPTSQTISVGYPVTFIVVASGAAPLSYQWQRNGTNIGGATNSSYTIAAVAPGDDGAQFRCIVSNSSGSATSNNATLTVTSDQPPIPTILFPPPPINYAAGDTIAYSGSATDPEDGALPPTSLTWWINFHHDTHFHPFMPPTTGITGGSFVVPVLGETSANVWYRIHLSAVDSSGLTAETYVDVVPRTSTMTFQTNPAGLQLTLDGQPFTSPQSVLGVVNMTRTLGAPSPQTSGGNTYNFVSWSDGGSQTHDISTPPTNTTYTANFTNGPTPTFTPTFTATRTPTKTPTFTPTGSATPTPTRTSSPTASNTPSPTRTPTPTLSRTPTSTASRTPTFTMSNTPTFTASKTPTFTASRTSTFTASKTPTFTASKTPTFTASKTPTFTASKTPTFTASKTPTFTASKTPTSTASKTPTFTASKTPTFTASKTPTFTASKTPTFTASKTPTFTASKTPTFTASKTPTFTASKTPTFTASKTPTFTASKTPTFTASKTPTFTASKTPTPSLTPTRTPTPLPGAPSVDAIAPGSGPAGGGMGATVGGAGFVSGATVKIGSIPAIGVTVVDATHIQLTVPAEPAGSLNDVKVTNPGNLTGVLPSGWMADFTDVPPSNPFHADVVTIVRDGVTAGCGTGIYCPNASVTRAQMAVFLLRAEHGAAYQPPPATGTVFLDVPANAFAAAWIEQLAAEQITGGCGGGNYCPTAPVTRAQMAPLLLRTEHGVGYQPPPASGTVFSDVPANAFAAAWIEQLAAEGVTSGCGGGKYCPSAATLRGQMATFLVRTFQLQ
jgi:glucose/arabinose dehydrogenase